ncbi:MAG: dienelactone hydrolase family protein [Nitrospirota bacterium]
MKRHMILVGIFFILGLFIASCTEKPAFQSSTIEYKTDGETFKGYIAYDGNKKGRRPGIIVVHEWWGQNDQVRRRADMLAGLGYTALVVDMFGNGRVANNSEEAAELAKEVSGNADLRRSRFMAAMDFLRKQETVDPEKIAAVGYSFGGYVVLQEVLDGADLRGAVSFYGGVLVNMPDTPGSVKGKILLLQGEKDWYVTQQMITQFKTDMKKTGADYEIITFKDAEHGYSNPESDALALKYGGMHIKYNEEADRKSWDDMRKFLEKVFSKA